MRRHRIRHRDPLPESGGAEFLAVGQGGPGVRVAHTSIMREPVGSECDDGFLVRQHGVKGNIRLEKELQTIHFHLHESLQWTAIQTTVARVGRAIGPPYGTCGYLFLPGIAGLALKEEIEVASTCLSLICFGLRASRLPFLLAMSALLICPSSPAIAGRKRPDERRTGKVDEMEGSVPWLDFRMRGRPSQGYRPMSGRSLIWS